MNENVRKRNAVLAQTVIKGLESRNMTGYYAKNKEEALKQALEIIGALCTLMARGALISMIMIIFILPAILLLFEKVIIKTSKGFIEPKKDNEQGNPVFAGNN